MPSDSWPSLNFAHIKPSSALPAIDDALACEQFDAFKCDPDSIFDAIDGLTETLNKPRTTTTVRYNDIE